LITILAAIAAPFVTGSYKVKLHSFREVPMTAEERAGLIAAWGENIEDCNKIREGDGDVPEARQNR
jgi:hypothetical protein